MDHTKCWVIQLEATKDLRPGAEVEYTFQQSNHSYLATAKWVNVFKQH